VALTMFTIDLEWAVASKYVLRSAKHGPSDSAICPAADAVITRYRPLEQYPALYAEFAKLDGSKRRCLAFAHKYGLLHTNLMLPDGRGGDPRVLETLRIWKGNVKSVADLIERCELSRSQPRQAFRQFGNRDVKLWGLELYVTNKSPNSPASIDMRASDLLAAIELQAITSIMQGHKSVQCIECSSWFEIGAGARRSQSKFCSVRCKDTYHNRLKAASKARKRSKEK
jgi:hypothetical protein